jgi:hypothetical protein
VPCLLAGHGLDPRDGIFWTDLAAIRLTPSQLYYFVPAWWYVGLLVQLYAIYPVLWTALRRLGAVRFLAVTPGLTRRAGGRAADLRVLPRCLVTGRDLHHAAAGVRHRDGAGRLDARGTRARRRLAA